MTSWFESQLRDKKNTKMLLLSNVHGRKSSMLFTSEIASGHSFGIIGTTTAIRGGESSDDEFDTATQLTMSPTMSSPSKAQA
jgi:hypothetical protein